MVDILLNWPKYSESAALLEVLLALWCFYPSKHLQELPYQKKSASFMMGFQIILDMHIIWNYHDMETLSAFMCCGKGSLAFTSSHRYGQILLIF